MGTHDPSPHAGDDEIMRHPVIWNAGYRQGFEAGAEAVDAIHADCAAVAAQSHWWAAAHAVAGGLLALMVLGIAGADRVAGLLVRAGCWGMP